MMPALPSVAYGDFFTSAVVTAEMREPGDPATLPPQDRARLARAVPKRVREFAAGRQCAQRALAGLGIDGAWVGTAADRQPVWPAAVVGSITHTEGFCAAAVASGGVAALGIDTEVVAAAAPRLAGRICVAAELDWAATLPEEERDAALMLIFSAKEAFFKCQYPLVGERLDFKDLRIEPVVWRPPGASQARPAELKLVAMRPLAIGRHTGFPLGGHYRFHERYVSTGVALQADRDQ